MLVESLSLSGLAEVQKHVDIIILITPSFSMLYSFPLSCGYLWGGNLGFWETMEKAKSRVHPH